MAGKGRKLKDMCHAKMRMTEWMGDVQLKDKLSFTELR